MVRGLSFVARADLLCAECDILLCLLAVALGGGTQLHKKSLSDKHLISTSWRWQPVKLTYFWSQESISSTT